jgi:hypothetical protein
MFLGRRVVEVAPISYVLSGENVRFWANGRVIPPPEIVVQVRA